LKYAVLAPVGAGRDPGQLEVTLGHQAGRISASRAADVAEDEISACAQRLGIASRAPLAIHD
jgi:hypothetical protein